MLETFGRSKRSTRKQFIRSLEETAARAVVTASVTFAVGWVLKKMFEKSVAEAAQQGAKAGVADELSEPGKAAEAQGAEASLRTSPPAEPLPVT